MTTRSMYDQLTREAPKYAEMATQTGRMQTQEQKDRYIANKQARLKKIVAIPEDLEENAFGLYIISPIEYSHLHKSHFKVGKTETTFRSRINQYHSPHYPQGIYFNALLPIKTKSLVSKAEVALLQFLRMKDVQGVDYHGTRIKMEGEWFLHNWEDLHKLVKEFYRKYKDVYFKHGEEPFFYGRKKWFNWWKNYSRTTLGGEERNLAALK